MSTTDTHIREILEGGDSVKIYKPDGRCNISGARVRAAREKAGISQEQLAGRIQLAGLNISQKAISRIETGDRVVADYELHYLSEALGITFEYLLGGAGNGHKLRKCFRKCIYDIRKRNRIFAIPLS